jgi:hypothetical protein
MRDPERREQIRAQLNARAGRPGWREQQRVKQVERMRQLREDPERLAKLRAQKAAWEHKKRQNPEYLAKVKARGTSE